MIDELRNTFFSLDTMLQIYWVLALVSSVVFIVQTVMTFVGFDADTDVDLDAGGDADFDSEGFHLVSVKSIVCFFLGFSWAGVLLWNSIPSPAVLGLVATVVGLLFMGVIAFALYQTKRLAADHTFRPRQVVGQTAEVYLRIPAQRQESGKVQVSYRGSTHELDALTDDPELIATGRMVRIVDVVDASTLLVTKV